MMNFAELLEIYLSSCPHKNVRDVTGNSNVVSKICTAVCAPYTITHVDNFLRVAVSDYNFGYVNHSTLSVIVIRIYKDIE